MTCDHASSIHTVIIVHGKFSRFSESPSSYFRRPRASNSLLAFFVIRREGAPSLASAAYLAGVLRYPSLLGLFLPRNARPLHAHKQ